MSTDLYYRRLAYYAGRGGIAKEGDLEYRLHVPPPVLPRIAEIDYGEIASGEMAWPPFMREHGDGRKRDLTPPEILLVRGWLASLLSAVVGAAVNAPTQQERRKP
jgi:hypothetical protein